VVSEEDALVDGLLIHGARAHSAYGLVVDLCSSLRFLYLWLSHHELIKCVHETSMKVKCLYLHQYSKYILCD